MKYSSCDKVNPVSEGGDSLLSVGGGVERRRKRKAWIFKSERDEAASEPEPPRMDKGERTGRRGNSEESKKRPNLRKSKRG